MSPERTDLVLTTDVPHGELNVLVLDGLDVEAWMILALALELLSIQDDIGLGAGDNGRGRHVR